MFGVALRVFGVFVAFLLHAFGVDRVLENSFATGLGHSVNGRSRVLRMQPRWSQVLSQVALVAGPRFRDVASLYTLVQSARVDLGVPPLGHASRHLERGLHCCRVAPQAATVCLQDAD